MYNLRLALVFTALYTVLICTPTYCLDCYKCTNIHHVSDCHSFSWCNQDELCYTDSTGVGTETRFTMGCRPIQVCQATARIGIPSLSIIERDESNIGCSQCCNVDACNKHICVPGSLYPLKYNNLGKVDGQPIVYKVDGHWSAWQLWSSCGVTCGRGIKTRERLCNNPAPSNGGEDCPWNGDETNICYLGECHIKGQWSGWSEWGLCSVSCGIGLKRRDRTCSHPYPSHDGDPCEGDYHEDRACLTTACSVKGQWSEWSEWGHCSVSCGIGLERRDRTCSNHYPGSDGNPCVGDYHEDRACLTRACSDGQWSSWSSWSSCSVTCYIGLKRRTRTCNNPSPSVGGRQCPGNSEHIDMCYNQGCSLITMSTHTPTTTTQSSTETESTMITEATTPTKPSTMTSRSTLTNTHTTSTAYTTKMSTLAATTKVLPPPAYTVPQSPTGQWSSWGDWSSCTATCNTGIKRRVRTCSNPAPAVGGTPCPENSEQFDFCHNLDCSTTQSSTTTETTTITQVTTLTKASTMTSRTTPTNTPATSTDFTTKMSTLATTTKVLPPPVFTVPQSPNGQWSSWGDWSTCTATCNTGIKRRVRTCSNPAPAVGGSPCPENSEQFDFCHNLDCSSTTTETKAITQATTSTKPPTMTSRSATANTQTTSIAYTTKMSTLRATTNTLTPPAYPQSPTGQWSSWGDWSSCSATCNTGIKRRVRTCSNPAPAIGGSPCPENIEQFDLCYNLHCSIVTTVNTHTPTTTQFTTTTDATTAIKATTTETIVPTFSTTSTKTETLTPVSSTKTMTLEASTQALIPAGHTITPNPTTCFVCMDDAPDMCDFLFAETTCAPPNNYCINQVINTISGVTTINRTCGNFDRCYADWYLASSYKSVCQTFDENQNYLLDFECVYCCMEDRCNEKMRPPNNTLYENK